MDRIRIDRRQTGLRMRRRQQARDAEASAPLRYAARSGAGGGDDDLLARIDAVVESERAARRHDEDA